MTLSEIAQRGGMTISTASWVAGEVDWSSISIETADKFLRGCGYEFSGLSKLRKYLKRTSQSKARPFSHLGDKKLTKRQIASISRNVERAAACQGGFSDSSLRPQA